MCRSAGGEKRADERERQRENGVLELDHFEHGADSAFVVFVLGTDMR